MASSYNPVEIEKKWQEYWAQEKTFEIQGVSNKKKMYVLDMFPYPSGDGLHVGHVKIYTASDVVSRYLRMKGYSVLHPTGWDAFGLPTENSAIKLGIHPAKLTERNVNRFRKQMQRMGFSYDWTREVNTTDPKYYKWTQWIFLQLFKMGLAYEDTIPINWCPSCKTGLANEEVIDGKCERCGTQVEERPMRQWMLRITKYADRLLSGIADLDWPQSIQELQKNWIGRSAGALLQFPIAGQERQTLEVFTTRIDTLFGATYVVISPDHPLASAIASEEQREKVESYLKEAQKPIRIQENLHNREKTGVFTGRYAINPATEEQIPIWIADYVLMSYGTGAVMAVPAHDERDYEFARQYGLTVKQVIDPSEENSDLPYTGEGRLINSGQYDGLESGEVRTKIVDELVRQGKARKSVQYKLRDWVFSRQRYWGEPIPIIRCASCGPVPVPEEELPVTLPEVERFEPTGTGESPLARIEEWVNVPCPNCGKRAQRETNTMPQWAGSSWYWIRYTSPHYMQGVADPEAAKQWLPVDLYVGGAEHAVLHLLYARFWSMVLKDAGVVDHAEPFQRFRAVGLVIGEDGEKMSKSRGNVVNPDDVVDQHGADTLRIYEMFMGPFGQAAAWDTKSIKGSKRFLERVWEFATTKLHKELQEEDGDTKLELHTTIRRVSEGIEQFKFNTAISALMELLNTLSAKPSVTKSTLETFVLLLSPLVPHIAEELWEKLGHSQSIIHEQWPTFDQWLLEQAAVTIPIQINGKVRGEISISPGTAQSDIEAKGKTLPSVAKHLEGKQISKVVYIPNRLINFVVVP